MHNNHSQHIKSLDGVRGLAVLMVLSSHFLILKEWEGSKFWNILSGGWLGVDLFFVLSGFLITDILLKAKGKPHFFSNFYKRRTLRIFPLYYAVVIFAAIYGSIFENTLSKLFTYDSILNFFAYSSNFAQALKNSYVYPLYSFELNHLWSLSIEEQFYLLWPLLVYKLSHKQIKYVLVTIILMTTPFIYIADKIFGNWSLAAYVLPICRFDAISIGALIALFKHTEIDFFKSTNLKLLYLTALTMLVNVVINLAYSGAYGKGTFSAMFFGILLYIVLSENSLPIFKNIFENKFLVHLGTYSYALYVFHHFLKPQYMTLFGNYLVNGEMNRILGQIIYFVLAFGITYLISRLSWIAIERPFLKLKDTWTK